MLRKLTLSLLAISSLSQAGQVQQLIKPTITPQQKAALARVMPQTFMYRCFEFSDRVVFKPGALAGVSLVYIGNDFYVIDKSSRKITQKIEHYQMSKGLIGLSLKQIEGIALKGGYFKLAQSFNGSFNLDLDFRLNGGGLGTAFAAYWGTKIVGTVGFVIVSGYAVATAPGALLVPGAKEAAAAASVAYFAKLEAAAHLAFDVGLVIPLG